MIRPGLTRWTKFNAVGIAGVVVQLITLGILVRAGMHYLLATAFGVEVAVLHNYFWHARWTWADRAERSLLRFHLANGLVSVVSNLAWMWILPAWPVVAANLLAITLTSVVNFLLGDRWAFAAHGANRRVHGLLQGFPGHASDEGPHDGPQQERHVARER